MPMRLLISDTNVLIDIEDGNLTPLIFRLPYEITVLDVLFESELSERHGHLLQAGLKVKSLTPEFVEKMEILNVKYPRPSIMDRLALALALQEQCPLLTGDRDLRAAAKGEGVEVHGTLWIVEQLLQTKLIEQRQARNSFDSMKAKGSRLPWNDAEQLMDRWGLVVDKNE
jgi:predicted nucleic acid-binding protein